MMTLDGHDIPKQMRQIGQAAKVAASEIAISDNEIKNEALFGAATSLRGRCDEILDANKRDIISGEKKGLKGSFLDRLLLDQDRIELMARGLEAVANLPDPVGNTLCKWEQPNGLQIERVTTPLGVVGVIYESRPNVTADAGALCLKSGNAVILRGGSESFHSSSSILVSLIKGLQKAGLPETAIQLVPTPNRNAVGEMLRLSDYIDVIVPRGGKSLIKKITSESQIPMFKHLEGICHIYVDKTADGKMAREIILNAKMRRTGICGAAETVLLHRSLDKDLIASIINDLINAGCEIRGDAEIQSMGKAVVPANEDDWGTEYLDSIITIGMVASLEEAIKHITKHGSNHTESIITKDNKSAEIFLKEVDSAIVMVNASTQFADGGEFGMGAEIGISTGKLHARGPVGVEQLTSFKYKVRGMGQCRT